MGDLEPITRNEKLWSGEDLTPVTRREMYIKHLYDETQVIPEYPVTREEMFILKAGEELHDVTIEQLTATENKTYSEEGVAYSPVIVNVPQTTLTTLDVTENGTYTAPSGTAYSEVDADVPLPENAYLLKEIEDVEIATFNDGSDLPMPKLEVAIEPVQEGSGDPSPENIRPISGWDEVNVTRTGKNWWSLGNISGTKQIDIDVNIPIGSWTFSCEITSADVDGTTSLIIFYYDDDTTFLTRLNRNTRVSYTLTATKHIKKISFYAGYNSSQSAEDTFTFANIQLEEGTTATTYEPYNGHTYTLDLDGTRYGGKVDLVSGVMTVDRAYKDLGDLTWQLVSTTPSHWRFRALFNNAKQGSVLISNSYKNITPADTYTGVTGVAMDTSSNYIFLCDETYDDVSDFQTAMNGVQLVYELATPLTIQLPPTVVKSLRGMNNVFADSGNILDLSYLAKEE